MSDHEDWMTGKSFVAAAVVMLMATAPAVRAETTNVIDLAALAACGTGVTNGWTLSGVDSYADDSDNVRLNALGEYLLSPTFAAPIRKLELKVKSSSETGRKLAFLPLVGETYDEVLAVTCEYSPNKDTYVSQELEFPSDLTFHAFKIMLDDGGGNTGWGFSYLAVITDELPLPSPPTGITVTPSETDCGIRLVNGENIVSNRVYVVGIRKVPESGVTVADYTFEECVNTGASETDKSKEFAELYPAFLAYKLYYPLDAPGAVRISTGKENGYLRHCGFSDYTGLSVEVVAKRYPGDTSLAAISVYSVDAGALTNVVGTVPVTDEFTTNRLDLTGVTPGAPLYFANLDGYKSNRRFLLDRLRFWRGYTAATTVTNVVSDAVYPAPAPDDAITVGGLSRCTEYRLSVSAIDSLGRESAFSEPLGFTTLKKRRGLVLILLGK